MATRVLRIQYAPGKNVKVTLTLAEFRIGPSRGMLVASSARQKFLRKLKERCRDRCARTAATPAWRVLRDSGQPHAGLRGPVGDRA
jgi:hypothetical protein